MDDRIVNLPKYKSKKEFRAVKIKTMIPTDDGGALLAAVDGICDPIKVNAQFLMRYRPQPRGYYIIDEDEVSWYQSEEKFEKENVLIK